MVPSRSVWLIELTPVASCRDRWFMDKVPQHETRAWGKQMKTKAWQKNRGGTFTPLSFVGKKCVGAPWQKVSNIGRLWRATITSRNIADALLWTNSTKTMAICNDTIYLSICLVIELFIYLLCPFVCLFTYQSINLSRCTTPTWKDLSFVSPVLQQKQTYIPQGSLNYPDWGDQTMQMYGIFEGFPVQ